MEESVIRNFWPGKTAGTQFSSVYGSILLPIFTLNLSFPLCKIVMNTLQRKQLPCVSEDQYAETTADTSIWFISLCWAIGRFILWVTEVANAWQLWIFLCKRSQDKKPCQQILSIFSPFLTEDQQHWFAPQGEDAISCLCLFLCIEFADLKILYF